MRECVILLYKFEELSEKAQEAAINSNRDINVDYEWWDTIYEDAADIGLNITGFDHRSVSATFIGTAQECAEAILQLHGDCTDTYRVASQYLKDMVVGNRSESSIESSFLTNLKVLYREMLSAEYGYLTSDASIKETIIANDYEFTSEGGMFHS